MSSMRAITAACLLLAVSAGAVAGNDERKKPSESVILEFTVMGMSCSDCANTATKLLTEVSGVRAAHVDFDAEKARVEADAGVDRELLRDALASVGFEAVFPGEKFQPPLTAEEKAALDIRVISHGESVDLEKNIPPGKITIVDYYAEWCGPCHILSPKLERLLLKYENAALRKVDIRDWKSDAAKQATHEFRLAGLPYVRVYDRNGKFIGAVVGNHIDRVEALVQKAAKQ